MPSVILPELLLIHAFTQVADYSFTITLCTEEAMKDYHGRCLVTYESTDIISLRALKV